MSRRTNTESISEQVTKEIIEEIERGNRPWEVPWLGGDDWPRNGKTRRRYIGEINLLILESARRERGFRAWHWVTAHQAEAMGGRVRAGEKATVVIFGRRGNRLDRRGRLKGGFGRLYSIFNVDQCDGLSPSPQPPDPPVLCTFPELDRVIAACGADLRIGGVRAFYHVKEDFIQMPPCRLFFDGATYARTTCHELAHWTRHPSRLNRISDGGGIKAYAWEEVVAELSAAILCRHLGLRPVARSSDYIAEWLEVLKREADAVAEARHQAEQAVDYLLRCSA